MYTSYFYIWTSQQFFFIYVFVNFILFIHQISIQIIDILLQKLCHWMPQCYEAMAAILNSLSVVNLQKKTEILIYNHLYIHRCYLETFLHNIIEWLCQNQH